MSEDANRWATYADVAACVGALVLRCTLSVLGWAGTLDSGSVL